MSKKGIKIFDGLTQSDSTKEVKKTSTRPGRRVDLAISRNRKLACRYYYYTVIIRYSYDDTMQALEQDFDLSKIRIIEVIETLTDQLRELKVKKATRDYFKKMFPFYSWEHKCQVPPPPRQREVFTLS